MRCRILSLLWLLAFASVGVAQAQTRVELRDTFPPGPDITVAPGANVYLRILIDTARDPTSHNLWSFEILMFGGGSVAAMTVLWVLSR